MHNASIHSLPFFLGLSAFLIVASVPLILRKIPRNRWYGLRIPSTMNGTEADWYNLNQKGGFLLLAIGLLLVPAARIFGLIQH